MHIVNDLAEIASHRCQFIAVFHLICLIEFLLNSIIKLIEKVKHITKASTIAKKANMTDVWLRYRDEDSKSYYYNVNTKETTYKFPLGLGSVWDAKNKKKLRLPGHSSSKGTNYSDEEFDNDNVSTNIPDYAADLIQQFAAIDVSTKFESKYLNKVKLDKLEHSDKPIDNPLLAGIKKQDLKTAARNYKLILKYLGYTPKGLKSNESIDEVLASLAAAQDEKDKSKEPVINLIDEVYFNLVKLSNKCKSKIVLRKVLKLFAAVATSFVPCQDFRNVLLRHLGKLAQGNRIAKFIALRLEGTFLRNAPLMPCRSERDIQAIFRQYQKGTTCFGVTITEIFFHMRHARPNAPVPYILYSLMNKVTELGGRNKENIYRVATSKAQDSVIAQANDGTDIVANLSLDEATVYLKKWLDSIPGKLIPAQFAEQFKQFKPPYESSAAQSFVSNLPAPTQAVLKYMMGYLRDYSQNSSVTRMDVKAFSDVFGPKLVFDDDNQNPIDFQKQQSSLITALITDYDTSGFYPLSPSVF